MFTAPVIFGHNHANSGEFQNLSTFADVAGSGVDWVNPGNAQTSDDSYATVVVSSVTNTGSDYLACTGLPLKIPENAVVQGIAMRWERRQDSGSIGSLLGLTKNGSSETGAFKNEAAPLPTTDTYVTHGGASDLWGSTWTPAEINAGTFGVLITVADGNASAGGHTCFVDHVQIAVYYS